MLDGFLDLVRQRIATGPVAGFDETGFRVDGRLAWVHCARTGKYTLLTVHPKRGKQAIEAMGVLPSFAGTAVHDAAAAEDQWCRATQAAEAISAMQQLANDAAVHGRDAVDPDALAGQVTRYRSAALIGASLTAARCGKLMRKHHALACRLLDRQDDYLRFTRDFAVPADNNGTEQDIRMAKLRQKVSGCLRTMTGARQFCAIRSYLSTAAKHGLGFFSVPAMLAEGRPWMPPPAPA